MTTLSEATAVRRSLIETVRVTLEDDQKLDSEQLVFLAESIADSLIDSGWVTEEPK